MAALSSLGSDSFSVLPRQNQNHSNENTLLSCPLHSTPFFCCQQKMINKWVPIYKDITVFIQRRDLMSSTVQCWCLLVGYRRRHPCKVIQQVLWLQLCFKCAWNILGIKQEVRGRKRGQAEPFCPQTSYLPPACVLTEACLCFGNEVAEDCTCCADGSRARVSQCGHSALAGVGTMSWCRKS